MVHLFLLLSAKAFLLAELITSCTRNEAGLFIATYFLPTLLYISRNGLADICSLMIVVIASRLDGMRCAWIVNGQNWVTNVDHIDERASKQVAHPSIF